MRRLLRLVPFALLLTGCRPSKAELDDIHRKLDALTVQQEQLIQNLGTQWAAERQQGAAPDAARELYALENKLDRVLAQIEELQAQVKDAMARAPNPTPRVRPGRPDPNLRYRVDIGNSHARGRSDALVTVVMWADYQCPFCKRVQPTIEKVRKHYGRDVRVVMKHNPLPMHNRAMAAAVAAEAAGQQGKFWQMHEKLYQDTRALTDENIERYAKELGLNMSKFRRDVRDPKLADRVIGEQEQGSKVGARGTPAFFINGRFLSGAQPFERFESLIDEELAHAKKLVQKGTKKSRVYKALMKDALDKP